MYKNQVYWTVTESNVLSNDTVGVQNYVYMAKNEAYAKLYRLWGYGANPESGEPRQLLSAYLTEHNGERIILLECKVFDYRRSAPSKHALFINYQFEDGSEAAPSYTELFDEGETYSVSSPVVSGYTADISVVEGTMSNEDITVTVTYTAA